MISRFDRHHIFLILFNAAQLRESAWQALCLSYCVRIARVCCSQKFKIVNTTLSPVHTKPGFYCVGTALFNFQERREIARKHIVREDEDDTATSLRPRRCYGPWSSIAFLLSSCWRLSTLFRRFRRVHCAFTAFTLHWRRVEDVRLHFLKNEAYPHIFISCWFSSCNYPFGPSAIVLDWYAQWICWTFI
jgi:hypothetical protein